MHNRICLCVRDWVCPWIRLCVPEIVCAGMRSWRVSVPGLRGKEDDPAQLTVSHAGQNNTITLLLTRTWHTSHLLPLQPHTGRHTLAHEQTNLKHTQPCTHTLLYTNASRESVSNPIPGASPWWLIWGLSFLHLAAWPFISGAVREVSHRLTHFLSVCLPKHCKQAFQTSMFSLELAEEERACRIPVYPEGKTDKNRNGLLCQAYRIHSQTLSPLCTLFC